MSRQSRFYESSSSSAESDEGDLVVTRSESKKTIGFYILQCRSAFYSKEVDWSKLLTSLSMLAQKANKSSATMRPDWSVASLRLCHQVECLLQGEDFPQDRQTRRRILNASQAKASIALQKKYSSFLDSIRDVYSQADSLLPDELFADSAQHTLDGLERHFISHPLSPIPIELINTFNIVGADCAIILDDTNLSRVRPRR